MQLIFSPKGSGYEAVDKSDNKKMYSLKKKTFGTGVYILNDKSNYKLYTFTQLKTISKPSFSVSHDKDEIIKFVCKSLEGTLILSAIGYDISGNPLNYTASSEDHYHFTIKNGEEIIGTVEAVHTLSNTIQYELSFDDDIYDDYISLFPAAIDMSFRQLYK